MTDAPTVDALRAAYFAAVRRYRRMSPEDFLSAVLDLCEGCDEDAVIGDTLKALAAEGSIDAAAAVMVFSDDDPSLDAAALDALKSVAKRSPALGEELVVAELTKQIGEYLDEQVALGKMRVTIDRRTGEKRYSDVKPKRRRRAP